MEKSAQQLKCVLLRVSNFTGKLHLTSEHIGPRLDKGINIRSCNDAINEILPFCTIKQCRFDVGHRWKDCHIGLIEPAP